MRFILPSILIIIAFGLFFLYTNKTYSNIRDLQKTDSSYNEALDNSKQLQAVRDELTSKYNNIPKESLDRLKKLLPSSVNNIRLILEIDDIAAARSMNITNVTYSNESISKDKNSNDPKSISTPDSIAESGKPYGTFPMEFRVEGSYENFHQFLAALEGNLRILDITGINFNSPVEILAGTPANYYSFNFKINTYWLKNN